MVSENIEYVLKILLLVFSVSLLSPSHSWIGLTTRMDLKTTSKVVCL